MSVERKSNGQLRLRCDAADCIAKFVPLRPLTATKDVRARAELYGWRCVPCPCGQGSNPAHVRRRTAAVAADVEVVGRLVLVHDGAKDFCRDCGKQTQLKGIR